MTLTAYTAALAGALLLPAGMLALAGCSTTTARSVEGPLLALGEAACEALLPMATSQLPGSLGATLGPFDVLVCKGAETGIAAALAGAGPSMAPVGQSAVLAHRPLRMRGRIVALVRAPVDVLERAQARLDAQVVAALPFDAGAEGGGR